VVAVSSRGYTGYLASETELSLVAQIFS
jgi:hypothetical protein